MAGDWIPLFVDTPGCPEIVRISSATLRTQNDVLAFAVRLWCYADRHSEDGLIRGVRLENMPDVLGGDLELWSEFIEAGWLEEREDGIYLPNCQWLATGGKARLKDTERKRQTRKTCPESVRNLSGNSRTKTGPEKRREEKSNKKKEEEDNSRVVCEFPTDGTPASWTLRQSRVDRWRELFPNLDVDSQIRAAVAWCEANPQKRKTAAGMPRFLSNWLSGAQNRGFGARDGPAKPARQSLEDLIPDNLGIEP